MHVSSKNISVYVIFDDQRFNDTLTNDVVSFEQLGPGDYSAKQYKTRKFLAVSNHRPHKIRATLQPSP